MWCESKAQTYHAVCLFKSKQITVLVHTNKPLCVKITQKFKCIVLGIVLWTAGPSCIHNSVQEHERSIKLENNKVCAIIGWDFTLYNGVWLKLKENWIQSWLQFNDTVPCRAWLVSPSSFSMLGTGTVRTQDSGGVFGIRKSPLNTNTCVSFVPNQLQELLSARW